MMKAAIMGYGTIGSGVAEILEKNRDVIAQKAGQEIALKYVLDLREFPESPVADKIIHDFKVIEADREVAIVVETMGGLNPAYPFVKACLEAGKHVATSNKALVAAHGTELLRIAREKGVNFFFEASVGGGIPIVRSLYRSLAGERIEEIAGILNGTTNYILTKMEKEERPSERPCGRPRIWDMRRETRRPMWRAGTPAARSRSSQPWPRGKRLILRISIRKGSRKLRTRILNTPRSWDVHQAVRRKPDGGGQDKRFCGPCDDREGSSPLFGEGCVQRNPGKGKYAWHLDVLRERGGKASTASAVVADMIEAAQNEACHVPMGWSEERLPIEPIEKARFRYFLRVSGLRKDGEALAVKAFGTADVYEVAGLEEFGLLTGEMTEEEFRQRAEALKREGGPALLQKIRAEL